MLITPDHLQRIAEHQPEQRSEFSLLRAAVAIILRDGEHGTEFLLMQRAKHPQDPWSGQMSFPGGKIEPSDESSFAAATREAHEEVGVCLTEQDLVGQLDDLYGLKVDNQYSVHVACYVFKPTAPMQPIGNHEVADLVWLPFAWLKDASNAHDYVHPHSHDKQMPAVLINAEREQVLWGLSLRMISMMFELLGEDLPVLTPAKEDELKQIEKQNMDSSKLDRITRRATTRGAS